HIADELKRMGDYLVMTMEPAWTLCEPYFRNHPPKSVFEVTTLDQVTLDEQYEQLIRSGAADGITFVGVGGGTVLDATKYFAYRQGSKPLLVPSITSTNAPFTDFISIRRNGGPFGFKIDGYPKKVMVDSELIRLAEPRFNRAGFGDLLYMQTTLNDWIISSGRGAGKPVDKEVAKSI